MVACAPFKTASSRGCPLSWGPLSVSLLAWDWCSDWCECLVPVELGTYSKFLCALHELNFRVALQARGVVTVQGALASESCLADTRSPSRCDARWSALTVGARGAAAGQTGNNTVSRDYEKIVCYLSVCCDDPCILSCHVASSVGVKVMV